MQRFIELSIKKSGRLSRLNFDEFKRAFVSVALFNLVKLIAFFVRKCYFFQYKMYYAWQNSAQILGPALRQEICVFLNDFLSDSMSLPKGTLRLDKTQVRQEKKFFDTCYKFLQEYVNYSCSV